MNDRASISELKAAALAEAKQATRGSSGLSRALGGKPTPQAISQWKHVPAERVLDVEGASGVSRERLRPDIYPAPEAHRVPA